MSTLRECVFTANTGCVMAEVSKTVVNAMVRSWRIARLSADTGGLGYPRVNILIRALMGRGGRIFQADDELTDADIVQKIVKVMPYEMQSVFEAYHLGLIRGERCAGPHEERANLLGITKSVYFKRLPNATQFLARHLGDALDDRTGLG